MNQEEMVAGDVQNHSAQGKRSQREPKTQTADGGHINKDVKLQSEKRSHKTPIILGIILVILVLIGAGFFAWYFCFYSQPEKVISDAVDDLLSADNIVFDGAAIFTPATNEDSALEQIEVDFDSAANQAPASSTTVTMKFVFENSEISLEIGSVQVKDGVAYLRVSGILDALERAGLTEALQEEARVFFDTLEIIDGEWWEISVTDLIDEFELEDETTNQLKATYECAYKAINDSYRAEFAELYREHSFMQLSRVQKLEFPQESNYQDVVANAGSTYYQVAFDYEELANFINALPESDIAEKLYACVNDNLLDSDASAQDFDEVSADELKEAFPEDTRIYFEISNWCHQLKTIVMQLADEDLAVNLGLKIHQDQQAVITVPDSYRPITELVDEIMEMTVNLLYIQQAGTINMTEEPWNN